MSDLLSPEDRKLISDIARRVKADMEERARALPLLLAEARGEARRLAEEIGKLPDVRRVLHFGSSATGRNFRVDSDIDLAISGGDKLAAMGLVETSKFSVDVIDIDRVAEPLRAAILEEGVILYEKHRGL